jgi:hypothetical protein
MSISIEARLRRGPATSKELQAATGFSQSGVSRQLRAMGDAIVSVKQGRTVHYMMACSAFGADDKLPLYRVDPHGNTVAVARLRPLAHGGFLVEPATGMPAVLFGENRIGLYDDLPYFLDDLRPQGFLGRLIAREVAALSPDFPSDPRNWNANHVGQYLLSNGDDLPGNLKLGKPTHLRARRHPTVVTPDDYPALADAVVSGAIPGSSAGGEQPKFTAYNNERGHVIVKFSPNRRDALARRWRDILITEHHASEALQAHDHPAAETRLLDIDGRLFLESRRFDRNGEFGRMPMISLQAVDAEFTGLGSNWPNVMMALSNLGLVTAQHAGEACFLWRFGQLINNTDMHLGNLSLSIEGEGFRILPAYDMCSMGFAPRGGELPTFDFSPPLNSEYRGSPSIHETNAIARAFWDAVAADSRISPEFRGFLVRGNPIDLLR